MPRVPTINRQPISTAPIRGARVQQSPSAAAFGATGASSRLSEQAKRTVDAAQKLREEAKKNANDLAVLEADKKLSDLETSLLYDPQTGAMNKKGKDSFATYDAVDEAFKSQTDEIAMNLANDDQRLMFEQRRLARKADIDRQLQRHISRETQKFDEGVTKSFIQTEKDAAVKNFHNPERINMAGDYIRVSLKQQQERNGLPNEWFKARFQEEQSDMHSKVLSQMVNGGLEREAKEYYKKNKDLLTGDDQIQAKKLVEEGSLRAESQMAADKIMKKDLPLGESLELARSISDAKKRDETVRRVKQQFTDRALVKEQEQTAVFEQVSKIVEQGKGREPIPPSLTNQLTGSDLKKINIRIDQLRKGQQPETDWKLYSDAKILAINPKTARDWAYDPAWYAKHRPFLSDSEFKEMSAAREDIIKGQTSDIIDGYRSDSDIVNSAIKGAKLNDEKAAQVKTFVDQEVIKYKRKNNVKIVPNEEVQKIVDLALKKQIPRFFGSDIKTFQVFQPDFVAGQIPLEEIKQMKQDLGREVSPAEAIKLYRKKLLLQGKIK